MIVLGIDTATAMASAALVEGGKLLCEEIGSGPRPAAHSSPTDRANHHSGSLRVVSLSNHAEVLLPLIDRLLERAGLSLAGISALAVAIGPGSFTGLRIGLSTVKGLAYGWEVPVVGIPTLPAVATRVNDREGFICPCLDARKKEVYSALFRRQDDRVERLTDDLVGSPERMVESVGDLLDNGPCLFIGDGARVYANVITDRLGERCLLTLGESYPSTAAAVARLAEERIGRQEFDPVGSLVPLYLRPSEAELKRKL